MVIAISTIDTAAAVFTVTNIDDSGPGSLRQAMIDANAAAGSDIIVFDSSFGTARTITLGSTLGVDSAADDQLTINGPGANLLTISGNNAKQIFFVSDKLSISGVTLTGGSNNNGGAAIDNRGTLNVANAAFTSNFGNNGGGAISNQGTATISSSTFDSNSTSFSGGAVSNSGTLTVRDCTFSSQTASYGGAIYTNGVSLTVSNCTFLENTVTSGSATGQGGGAIHQTSGGNTIIDGSTFTSNHEIGGSGGGGGVRNRDGTMTISNSTFKDNTSVDGGGAIQNSSVLTINYSIISNNITTGPNAQQSGEGAGGGVSNNGGQLTVNNSVITGNSAATDGGGVYIVSSVVTITNSTISNNIANTNSDIYGDGGGIWIRADGTLTVSRSVISGNTTHGNTETDDLRFAGHGGALFAIGNSTLENTTVSGNVAEYIGGGIYSSFAGGNNGNLTVNSSTIVNNTGGGAGGVFWVNTLGHNPVNIGNTIVANNGVDVSGTLASQGYNLIEDTTGTTFTGDTTGNITGQDPLLGPLGNYGGPTETHALLAGSPAIDQGNSPDAMIDQRTLPRPYNDPSIPNATGGDGSDIGAFEDQPPNTLPGDDVTVEAVAGDANVTFDSVTQEGFTIFAPIQPPSAAGLPPAGYTILEDAPAYDITTTATYSAPVTVCFTVSSIDNEEEFSRVRILHLEDGELVDRTILAPDSPAPDFASRTVCASVDSLSPFVVALAPVPPNILLNISTRVQVLTDDKVLIGGFIVGGDEAKTVILRAIGPSLADFGITDALTDPVLELHAGDGSTITSNDNWKMDQQSEIEMTGLQPTKDLESAIVATLEPGAYTAIVSGKNGGTGVGLVEVYDLDTTAASELANISTRGFVEVGNNVMIGGFILSGETGGSDVLIRAIGPSLTPFGVAGALADPSLELHDGDGNVIGSNNDWKESQQGEIEATGLAPQDELESALFETLEPGAYTAIVTGQGGGTGVALVEAYRLP